MEPCDKRPPPPPRAGKSPPSFPLNNKTRKRRGTKMKGPLWNVEVFFFFLLYTVIIIIIRSEMERMLCNLNGGGWLLSARIMRRRCIKHMAQHRVDDESRLTYLASNSLSLTLIIFICFVIIQEIRMAWLQLSTLPGPQVIWCTPTLLACVCSWRRNKIKSIVAPNIDPLLSIQFRKPNFIHFHIMFLSPSRVLFFSIHCNC